MPIYAELSPVNDFRETAICRQFKHGLKTIFFKIKFNLKNLRYCSRGNLCNFLHFKSISLELKRQLKRQVKMECKTSKISNKKSNYLTKTNETISLTKSYYNNIDSR